MKRAPQKLSFCLSGWILVPSGYWATYCNEKSLTLQLSAKQIQNVLATFAATLVATFLLWQPGRSQLGAMLFSDVYRFDLESVLCTVVGTGTVCGDLGIVTRAI